MSGWIITTLAASTALMLLVLVLRGPVARLFGARAAYALWLLPALRMVLPPLPEGVSPVTTVLPRNVDIDALMAATHASIPAALPGVGASVIAWGSIVAAIWLSVAAMRFASTWLAYRRFMTRALDGARLLEDGRGISVHLSGRLAGPLAAGVVARRIVVPHDFHTRFDPAEQRLALAHEAAHHARGDTIANAVALIILALHWWNPIAHRAWRAFRLDQELACDALVLGRASAEERHAYGSALLKAAFGGTPAAACGMARAAELKQRMRALMTGGRSAGRTVAGGWLAAALVLGGLVGTATGGAAAERVRAFGDRVKASLPALPVMPAEPAVPTVPLRPATQPVIAAKPARPAPKVTVDGVRYVPAPAVPVPPAAPKIVIDGVPVVAPPAPPASPLPPSSQILSARERAEIGRMRAEVASADIPHLAEQVTAAARAALARECERQGIRISVRDAEMARLVECQRQSAREQVRQAMRQARAEMAQARAEMARAGHERARDDLERQLEQMFEER